MLFGPPGTGKTLLARAAAAECGASFLAIHPSTVASKWLGDGVRYMRAVFSLASKLSPCVLFIDEVDAMLSKRDSQREHEAHRELKNEFMAQWDGIRTGSSSSIDRVKASLQLCRLSPSDLGQQRQSNVTMPMLAARTCAGLQAFLSYILVLTSTLSQRTQHQDCSGLCVCSASNLLSFPCVVTQPGALICLFSGDGPWCHQQASRP